MIYLVKTLWASKLVLERSSLRYQKNIQESPALCIIFKKVFCRHATERLTARLDGHIKLLQVFDLKNATIGTWHSFYPFYSQETTNRPRNQ